MARHLSHLRIYVTGTLIALVLALAAVLFFNPPQCPDSYTQAQIDTSNCVVGANIGLGLLLMLAGAVEVVSIVAAIASAVVGRHKN